MLSQQELDAAIDQVVQDIARALSRRNHGGLPFSPANPRPDGLAETNDCVVRALSLAFNRPYLEVLDVCAAAGRRPRRGMYRPQTDAAIRMLSGSNTAEGVRLNRYERVTFARFARENPVGRFIVIKRGHAVALIDGVYHDTARSAECSARCQVQYYYRAA